MNFKMFSCSALVTTTLLGFAVTSSAQAALVKNGSFENGNLVQPFITLDAGSTAITDWTVTNTSASSSGGQVDYIGNYWKAADGVRSLDLSGVKAGGIQQAIETVIGQQYSLSFAMAGNPDGLPNIKTLGLVLEGSGPSPQTYTFDITNPAGITKDNMGWVTKNLIFTSQSTSTVLRFFNAGPETSFGPALDNVSVTAVPTPALLPGLIAMGVGIMRKRKAEAVES